jgi:hypothetical protein
VKIKNPPGHEWRPGFSNPKLLRLYRLSDRHDIGSIEPKGRKWMNNDTGELFADRADAAASIERWI